MKGYSFKDDYSEGCHPNILKKLSETSFEQHEGYGDDKYCIEACELICKKIGNSSAHIHFVSGGTQANLIVISAALRSHESVISASTGHINTHEAGSIEATGHKINAIPSTNGKLTVKEIEEILNEHITVPHMVKPKLVYISNSTEAGTVYKKSELESISYFCRERGLILFLDGARLGSALCSTENDLTLEDIARLTDIFYIGGTKNGALLGEAIVITNEKLKEDFPFHMKQRGALMSKGRLLGIQFLELFKNDLFFELAKHANMMAARISKALEDADFSLFVRSTTNQIFPVLPNGLIEKLQKKYGFYVWKKIDKYSSVIRLVTSWATLESEVNEFISDLNS